MAEATFTLRAVDATKQAFASVQNSLQRLENQSKAVGGFFKKAFGTANLGATLATALGINFQNIADSIARFATGQSEETQKLQAELEALGDEAINSAMALAKARNTDEQNLKSLLIAQERLNKAASQPAKNLAETVQAEKTKIALNKVDLEILIAREKIESDRTNLFTQYTKAVEDHNSVYQTYLRGQLTEKEQQEQINGQLNSLVRIRKEDERLLANVSGKSYTQEQAEAMRRMIEDLPKINALLSQRREIETDLGRIATEAGNLIAQGFEDAILSGQKLGEVVRSLGRDLVRLVFNQMVTQRLASGIATFLGAPPIPVRAMGGPVSSGSPYVVGEKGPELFVPHASGTIVPNNKMGGGSGSGGGSVTVNYNIAAGVSRAELVPILDQERRRLKAEIPDMVRRGGGYRAAFA
jgi:phage-related minor tail protein